MSFCRCTENQSLYPQVRGPERSAGDVQVGGLIVYQSYRSCTRSLTSDIRWFKYCAVEIYAQYWGWSHVHKVNTLTTELRLRIFRQHFRTFPNISWLGYYLYVFIDMDARCHDFKRFANLFHLDTSSYVYNLKIQHTFTTLRVHLHGTNSEVLTCPRVKYSSNDVMKRADLPFRYSS